MKGGRQGAGLGKVDEDVVERWQSLEGGKAQTAHAQGHRRLREADHAAVIAAGQHPVEQGLAETAARAGHQGRACTG
jgi:hypothetical protein